MVTSFAQWCLTKNKKKRKKEEDDDDEAEAEEEEEGHEEGITIFRGEKKNDFKQIRVLSFKAVTLMPYT